MRRISLVLLAGLWLVSGCSRKYVITLHNGTRIETNGKPRLEKHVWVYKDAHGEKVYVSAGRVKEVAPASMATEESQRFKKN